jgi:hypothetical protein
VGDEVVLQAGEELPLARDYSSSAARTRRLKTSIALGQTELAVRSRL